MTTVSTSTIVMPGWLLFHIRSISYSLWIGVRNRPNTPISTTASCWHLWRLGMHLGTMHRSGCYGTAAWDMSVSRLWRSWRQSPMLPEWPASEIASVASNANWGENPSLQTQHPVPLTLCSLCTWTYAVPWKQPSQGFDICCPSSTTPRGIWMSTYWSTSQKPLRNSMNGKLLETRRKASKGSEIVQMEAVSISPQRSQNT